MSPTIIGEKRRVGRLVGTLIGKVGFLVVGLMVGLVGSAVRWTGGLVGIVGIVVPGETSIGGLIISGLIARSRMEASFAMATLKEKRAASVIVR